MDTLSTPYIKIPLNRSSLLPSLPDILPNPVDPYEAGMAVSIVQMKTLRLRKAKGVPTAPQQPGPPNPPTVPLRGPGPHKNQ